jgi:hypothetical protein
MKTKNEIEPVEVFAGTAIQASLVKSLLENAQIVVDEYERNMKKE